jgi:hypothetical protein
MSNCVVVFESIAGEREGKWEDDGQSGRVRFRLFDPSGEGSRTSEKSREEPDRRSEAVI